MVEKLKKLFIPIFLIVILIIYFNKILFKEAIFIPGDFLRSDTLNQNLPYKFTLFNDLKFNKLPLWTNLISGGYPLAAEGQTGVFYPLNILFLKLFNFIQAYNLLIFINFLILSFGIFVFTRALKLNFYASILASTIYPLCSFFILHITHQNILAASSWLPLIYYSNYKLFKSGNLNYFFGGIFLISLSILAGSSQMTFYIIFSLFIFLLLFSNSFKFSKKYILILFFMEIISSLLICSIQIIPTYELIGLSVRSQGLGNIALNSLPYHYRNLISFISPYVFGDPGLGTYPRFGESWGMFWENTGYIGLIPLFLAITTLRIIKNNKTVRTFWILSVISLLLTLGKYSPLFWVYYLPIFNFFRVTSRFLVVLLFYLTILASFGLNNLISNIKDKFNKIIITSFILLLTLFDLFVFGYGYNPVIKASDVFKSPQNAEFIHSFDNQGRIFSLASTIKYDEINKNGWRNNFEKVLFHKNSLDPDVNVLWNLKDIDAYSGLNLKNNNTLIEEVYSGINFNSDKLEISDKSLKILGVASVEYIISPFELGSGIKPIFSAKNKTGEYFIYKNSYYLTRGFLITKLDSDINSLDISKISKDGNISKIKDEPDNIVFEVNSVYSQWFVLQDTYYPGWEVYINGIKSEIHKEANIFRAVKINKGKSTIEFKYLPKSFLLGKILTLISLILIIFSWIFFKYRKANYNRLLNFNNSL